MGAARQPQEGRAGAACWALLGPTARKGYSAVAVQAAGRSTELVEGAGPLAELAGMACPPRQRAERRRPAARSHQPETCPYVSP